MMKTIIKVALEVMLMLDAVAYALNMNSLFGMGIMTVCMGIAYLIAYPQGTYEKVKSLADFTFSM